MCSFMIYTPLIRVTDEKKYAILFRRIFHSHLKNIVTKLRYYSTTEFFFKMKNKTKKTQYKHTI